jgi:hypothetical protein
VRSTFASLEQLVDALEDAARRMDVLPPKDDIEENTEAGRGWQGMHELLGGTDNMDGIFRDLNNYSRFSSVQAP